MKNICRVAMLLAPCSLVLGQLSSYSITITSTRSIALQSDQAVFNVTVTSGLTTGLDDVISALLGSGITAANLSGVGTQSLALANRLQQVQQWSFSVAVQFSQIQTTITALTTVQQGIVKNNNGMTLGFSLQGTQVSQQLRASQTCAVSDLVGDARAQAQKVAGAAGFGVGSVLALSSGNTSIPINAAAAILVAGFSPYFAPSPTLTCSVVVKFGLVPN
jgi:uncharacterized protein YggE